MNRKEMKLLRTLGRLRRRLRRRAAAAAAYTAAYEWQADTLRKLKSWDEIDKYIEARE